jgi:xanthosine utilization system XapX-like protein
MKFIHFLALVPFIGMLIGPAVHNAVRPFILGMPFPLGWITTWVVLTAVVMAIVYALDPANRDDRP